VTSAGGRWPGASTGRGFGLRTACSAAFFLDLMRVGCLGPFTGAECIMVPSGAVMPIPTTTGPSVFAAEVLMIRPAAFGFNPETAASNGFQALLRGDEDVASAARREFDGMVEGLTGAGVGVWVWEDDLDPPRPDAVFPNNWLSTHMNGRVYLYPMATVSRRREIRREHVAALVRRYRVAEVVDWTGYAEHGQALEGTGSLVIDARRRRVFACRSSRTDPALVHAWAAAEGHEAVLFDAFDGAGRPIYHTNVICCVGEGFAACGLALVPTEQREGLRERLAETGICIELSPAQIDRFAGNMLQLRTRQGTPVLVLSQAALDALRPDQRRALEARTALLPVRIPTIEALGGGSARCMLAELLLAQTGG